MKTMTFFEAFDKVQASSDRAFRMCAANRIHMFDVVYPQLVAGGMTHQRALAKICREVNAYRKKVLHKHKKRSARYYRAVTRLSEYK